MAKCEFAIWSRIRYCSPTNVSFIRYRGNPGWVKLILIRKVTDITSIGIESKNEPKRFEEAFEDVPKDAWHVFEDPAECQKHIERVLAA